MGADASNLRPWFLVGPTAVGKSEIALILAERHAGEIISVDSMQVYRGLNIGTAKPTAAERARVPHHLVDVVDLGETFDAAQFVSRAHLAVTEIQARGHQPIFCGGTGLYLKAYLAGLGEAPPADPTIRAELEASSLDELLAELAGRDPATFDRIDRRNPRRVVRALEVIRITGRPFSDQRAAWSATGGASAVPIIGLARAGEDLRTRVDARVDRMFSEGLVAETESLLDHGLENNAVAMQAIGYRQVVEHLRGARSLPETIALVKARTRQFAKRQMTWFRRQLPVTWLQAGPNDPAEAMASQIDAVLASPEA